MNKYSHKNQPRASSSEIRSLCELLTPIMNDLHGLTFSHEFWSIVLGDYVKTCLHRKHYLSQENVRNYLLLKESDSPTPITWMIGVKLNVYHRLKDLRLRSDGVSLFVIKKYYGTDIYIGNKFRILINGDDHLKIPLNMPRFAMGKSWLRAIIKKTADQLPTTFNSNMVAGIPKYYVEYFSEILNRIPELPNSGSMRIHQEHYENVLAKIMAAYYRERGGAIIQYQKGGDFGEIEALSAATRYYEFDEYRTYGWKIHEKDRPFFALRLEEFASKYRAQRNRARSGPDALVIYNYITNEGMKNRYARLSAELFERLDAGKFRKVVLRPRGMTRAIRNDKSLGFLKLPDNVEIDRGQNPLYELLATTRIVVHFDHPSTNFLECVFVHHPVIVLQTNTDPSHLVEPFYGFFERTGVMHRSLQALVDHLNRIDIREWWDGVISQPEFVEFQKTFARSRDQYKESLEQTTQGQ